jgi:hypothetical protein
MTKLETIAIDWLNKNYNHLEPFYMEKYPDYLFHMKNGRCILQYNKKCGYVYVSYKEIWSFFESYFSMSNQQIKDITKIWVEEHYKMGVTKTTTLDKTQQEYSVEEHYKMEVTTDKYIILDELVEEHYEKNIVTERDEFWQAPIVEEHYKKSEITTEKGFTLFLKVEEHYKKSVTINELDSIIANRIEEQYQEIKTTNDQSHFYFERDVEELYKQNTNGK